MIGTAHLNVYSHSQDFSMLVRLLQVRLASKVRCLRCNAVKGMWNKSNEGLFFSYASCLLSRYTN